MSVVLALLCCCGSTRRNSTAVSPASSPVDKQVLHVLSIDAKVALLPSLCPFTLGNPRERGEKDAFGVVLGNWESGGFVPAVLFLDTQRNDLSVGTDPEHNGRETRVV